MKYQRKPDLLLVLAVVVGLGIVASGFAQEMRPDSPEHNKSFARLVKLTEGQ